MKPQSVKGAIQAVLLAVLCAACSAPSKIISTTITTTGKVAVGASKVAVTTTGKVAGSTASATGTVVKTTAGVASAPMKTAFVTFRDTTTGVARQVPWTEGLKLYGASKIAEVDLYMKAFQIVRQGGAQIIKSDWHKLQTSPEPNLEPGDLVEVRRLPKGGKKS